MRNLEIISEAQDEKLFDLNRKKNCRLKKFCLLA